MGPGPDLVRRAQGRAGPVDHRLPRRVQLGRLGDLDPDPQRGRDPAGLAVQHGRRPDPAQGADKGEPDKYYPSGKRTYGRVVPADHIQAAAQVTYQKDSGCKKTYILNDKEVYGKGLATGGGAAAKTQGGLQIVADDGIDTKAANFRSVAQKIKASGADCMFFGGITQNKGVQVFTDVNAANPNMKLFGPDGVADRFVEKISSRSRRRPTSPPRRSIRSSTRRRPRTSTRSSSRSTATTRPYAIYGYEAMKVALLAIQNAGDKGNDRAAVIDAFFHIKNRDSVLGKYSIDENGDTTLSDYGANRVKSKKLVFDKVIKAQTGGQGSRHDLTQEPAGGASRPGATGRAASGPRWPPRHHGSRIDPRAAEAQHRHGAPPAQFVLRQHPLDPHGDRAADPTSSRDPKQTLDDVKTGLSNGAVWALIALGYTLVYGIVELINFAHGEVFMIGSFILAVDLVDARRRRRTPASGGVFGWIARLRWSWRCWSAAR